MKGFFKKISYSLVLMAVVLFMGVRSMPHHHCNIGSGTHSPHAVHFGFGDCESCEHEHGCDEERSHTCTPCLSDSHFLRITDDNSFFVKKAGNMQSLFIQPDEELLSDNNFIEYYDTGGFFSCLSRAVASISLRAPPVVC